MKVRSTHITRGITLFYYTAMLTLLMLLPACSDPVQAPPLSETDVRTISKQVKLRAQNWAESWNGKVDSEKMMENYHPEMKYVWRGVSPPGDYEGTEKFARAMPSLNTNYQISLSNLDITVIDRNNAVVFFQFHDLNDDPYGNGAASLVMTKLNNDWKIIYVHESTIDSVN